MEKMLNNKNNNNRKSLYLKQENMTMNKYNEKKNQIKNYYDIIYGRYQQSQEFFELFLSLIKDYKETKLKNIENLNGLLNKYFKGKDNNNKKVENRQIDTIKTEFKEIINNQIKAEQDTITQLNYDNKVKNLSKDIVNSKKLLEKIKTIYDTYLNSINLIEEKNIKYLKLFNEYENRLIDIVDKNIKNKKIDNNILKNGNGKKKDININDFVHDEKDKKEINEMTQRIIQKEQKYKVLLKEHEEKVKQQYAKLKKCIDELSKYHYDFNDQENQLFTFVYFGYESSIENQKNYKKEQLNFDKLAAINFRDYTELNSFFEAIPFEQYSMTLISSNKNENPICKRIPPEVIIKLSCIINSHFPYIPKLEEGDFEGPNDIQIRTVTDKLFTENDLIPENEINDLLKLLNQSTFRLKFMKNLNYIRIKGIFELTGKHLIILGNIIKTITDLFDIKNDDFEVLKLLIIMSQTYYTLNHEKKKIYLIKFIEDHKLFHSEEIWKYYIDESIRREMIEKGQNINNENDEDEETKNFKKCNIYFSVLLSTTQNILAFQINKDIIKTIIINLINEKYNQLNLFPIYIEQILSLIEETVYNKKNKFNVDADILGKK
jgi:hypothetical protein